MKYLFEAPLWNGLHSSSLISKKAVEYMHLWKFWTAFLIFIIQMKIILQRNIAHRRKICASQHLEEIFPSFFITCLAQVAAPIKCLDFDTENVVFLLKINATYLPFCKWGLFVDSSLITFLYSKGDCFQN